MTKRKSMGSRARREVRAAEMGAVYTFRVPDGRFGACQVVSLGPSKGEVEIVTLDCLSPEAPLAESVSQLKVLRQAWANWDGAPARCIVDSRVPWWAERVAVIAPSEKFDEACPAYGGWQVALAAYNRDRWERTARWVWKPDEEIVHIDLGSGAVALRRDSTSVDIGPGGELAPPITGEVRFDALDALPCLAAITYTGRDAGVVDYVIRRKLSALAWYAHGQQTIDLHASCLERMSLDVPDQSVTLRAPGNLQMLSVRGQAAQLEVEGARSDFPFSLLLEGPCISRPPRGLEAVQIAEYRGLVDTDTSGLAAYTRLAELTLRGAPGKLRDASTLSSLGSLRELGIQELYELDGKHWPADWPLLDGAQIHGLGKADAQSIKAALAAVPVVRITGARSDDWIEANLSNPFREWEEDNLSFGRSACEAWRRAKTEATELGPRATWEEAEKVLKGLVSALNRLSNEHDIDTLRREEAGEAFLGLARNLGISDDQADSWFDAWRDF